MKEKQARNLLHTGKNDDHNTTPHRSLSRNGYNGQAARSDHEMVCSPHNARDPPSPRPVVSQSSSYLTKNMPGALPGTPSEVGGDDYGTAGHTATPFRR